jgi:iron-sulfur cluster assembly accessory protein
MGSGKERTPGTRHGTAWLSSTADPEARQPSRDQEGSAMTIQDETVTDGILLTETASSKVRGLLDQEGRDDLSLRVAVQPGGCSGLRYQLFFDERSLDGDVLKDFGGVSVVVDRMSAPYLAGATIDFVDTIEKQGFTIDNPNAGGSCACGDSFH